MLRLSMFLLLSLAVHVAVGWLLHGAGRRPALAQASAAPQVLRLVALQQLPAPQPPALPPQPQRRPDAKLPKGLPDKPLAPKVAAVAAPRAPAAAKPVAPTPVMSEPASADSAPAAAPVASNAPAGEFEPREVLSREPRFREPPGPPSYPAQARRRNQQGRVMLEVRLDARGEQLGLSLLRSSGIDSLDRAALEAVSGWRFRPQTAGGRAVPSRVQIPIEFALTASR